MTESIQQHRERATQILNQALRDYADKHGLRASLDSGAISMSLPPESALVSVDRKWLLAALTACEKVASNETARRYLCGVCVQYRNAMLHVVATDGHRLVAASAGADLQAIRSKHPGAGVSAILPNREGNRERDQYARPTGWPNAKGDPVKEVLKALRASNEQRVNVRIVDGEAIFIAGHMSYSVPGNYPDWGRVIPCAVSLDRYAIIHTKDFRQWWKSEREKGNQPGKLLFEADRVSGHHLYHISEGGGFDDLPHHGMSRDMYVAVNAAYLRSLLPPGNTVVELWSSTESAPVKINAPDGFVRVLMPVRV